MTRRAVPVEQRILTYTTKKGDCNVWSGCINNVGYPMINVKGKMKLVHRVVYEMEHGALLPNDEVHHACENKLCVNPEHLHLGTMPERMYRLHKHVFGQEWGSK